MVWGSDVWRSRAYGCRVIWLTGVQVPQKRWLEPQSLQLGMLSQRMFDNHCFHMIFDLVLNPLFGNIFRKCMPAQYNPYEDGHGGLTTHGNHQQQTETALKLENSYSISKMLIVTQLFHMQRANTSRLQKFGPPKYVKTMHKRGDEGV